jgi:hypothetical protein
MKSYSSTIDKLELVRTEKKFQYGEKYYLYFYYLWISTLDEPVLLEDLTEPIIENLVGKQVDYKVDSNGIVRNITIT